MIYRLGMPVWLQEHVCMYIGYWIWYRLRKPVWLQEHEHFSSFTSNSNDNKRKSLPPYARQDMQYLNLILNVLICLMYVLCINFNTERTCLMYSSLMSYIFNTECTCLMYSSLMSYVFNTECIYMSYVFESYVLYIVHLYVAVVYICFSSVYTTHMSGP